MLALFCAFEAAAADVRGAFRQTKAWSDFASAGVIVRELWLPVDGTSLSLVHLVRTSPAVPTFEGFLFAVDAAGAEWSGAVRTDACPTLDTVQSMTVLYRQGGSVMVRLGQGDAVKKPFATCGELYRARDLEACTLRVPIKEDSEAIESGPDQKKLGTGWIAAGAGRVDVPKAPSAGLKLTSALRDCIGEEEIPVMAPLEDRLAIAGKKGMLLVSDQLSSVCLPCDERPAEPAARAPMTPDAVAKKHRSATAAWRAGRRDDALLHWRQLYAAWWGGSRDPAPIWVDVLEGFGAALAALGQTDQAKQVFEECWSMTKTPSASLMISMGDAYRDLGDVDAARAAYERALAEVPTRAQHQHATTQLQRLKSRPLSPVGERDRVREQ